MKTKSENRSLLALSTTLFLMTLMIFYPGFFSEDSIAQIEEARSGLYSDGNPPLMAFIWRYVDQIYEGQAGMLALQLALYWAGLYLIVTNANLAYKKRIFFLICVGLFPGTLGILGTIWKDVLMMAFGVFGIGLGMAGLNKKSNFYMILSLVSFFVACSMRQNGIFVLPPIVFGTFYSYFSYHKIGLSKLKISILAATVGTVLFVCLNSILTYGVFDSKKTHLWRLLPLFDLAGIYYHIDRLPEENLPPFATSSFTIDKLRDQYTPRSLMPVVLPLCTEDKSSCNPPPFFDIMLKPNAEGSQQLQDLKFVWLQEIKNHPLAYLTHRIKAFSHLLGVHGSLWGPVYFWGVDNKQGLTVEPTKFQKGIASFLRFFIRFGFFSAYLFLFLNFFLIYKIRHDLNDHKSGFIFGTILSALFFEMAYLFITPSMDYRYSYWFIVATLICGYLHFFQEKKSNQEIPTDI